MRRRCARHRPELADEVFRVEIAAALCNALHAVAGGKEQFLRALDARADDVGKESRIKVFFIEQMKIAAAHPQPCGGGRDGPCGGG